MEQNQTINNILFTNRWTNKINELNSENISSILYESQPEKLGKTTIYGAIGIK